MAPKGLTRARTTVVVDRTLEERVAAHQALIAARAAAPAGTGPLNILADGDSWFDYPLTDDLPIASDVIVQLPALLDPNPLILNLAHHGDATTDMMGVSKRNRFVEALNNPQNGGFDAILFSGGGNDIAGEQLRLWLKNASDVGSDPTKAIDEDALGDILSVVRTSYRDLLAARDAKDKNIPIFVNGYDFAFPTNEGVCGLGPWVFPSLQSRGWMANPSGTDLARGRGIVTQILGRFKALIQGFAASNVIWVETQGTLGSVDQWANELHPSSDGFGLIAAKFANALVGRFGGRVAFRPPAAPSGPPVPP